MSLASKDSGEMFSKLGVFLDPDWLSGVYLRPLTRMSVFESSPVNEDCFDALSESKLYKSEDEFWRRVCVELDAVRSLDSLKLEYAGGIGAVKIDGSKSDDAPKSS
jgi:hypothetical protein